MPRQYIDPQPLLDRIEQLETENAELKAKLESRSVDTEPSRGETAPVQPELPAQPPMDTQPQEPTQVEQKSE